MPNPSKQLFSKFFFFFMVIWLSSIKLPIYLTHYLSTNHIFYLLSTIYLLCTYRSFYLSIYLPIYLSSSLSVYYFFNKTSYIYLFYIISKIIQIHIIYIYTYIYIRICMCIRLCLFEPSSARGSLPRGLKGRSSLHWSPASH